MGAVNLDIPYLSLHLLATFVLKHNVDEKNVRNIQVRIHVTRIAGDRMLI